MNAARGMAIFIFIFIVIPWGLIFALRLVGHRRGYDSLYAPSQDVPLADRPLHCRLNLFHRWRSMHTQRQPLPTLPGLWEDPRYPDRRTAAIGCRRSMPHPSRSVWP